MIGKNFVLFDVEVYSYDCLLGIKVVNDNGVTTIQTWDLNEIKKLYALYADDIWIGHNNKFYDNFILQGVVNGLNEEQLKALNDNIILRGKTPWLRMPLNYYDLTLNHFCALKTIEAFVGKNISETTVDFSINRKLTEEEKLDVESYNRNDLDQTLFDFVQLKNELALRLDIIEEFNLPMNCLCVTGTQLAEKVLHAERISGISSWVKKPVIWPTLKVQNQKVIDWYLNENWRNKITLNETFCKTEHTLAAGGIHGAKKKFHCDWAYYFDVSGYYNLIMIIHDLLPRSIPVEYRQFYEDMYHTQLALKKTNPGKRGVYKTILLSVFGAMNNEFCKFYDPYNGDLVRLTGQMYLVDLLEKCENKLEIVQSNTDGIMLLPINGTTEEEVMSIMTEWQDRTGFVLKLDKVYDIHQRDVNTYMYRDSDGEIHTLGDTITHYDKIDWPFWKDSYRSKEPLIIAEAVVEYFMNKKRPEQVIEEKKKDLRYFQYICKKASYDYLEYEEYDVKTNISSYSKLQHVNRAFAMKDECVKGMIYKRKFSGSGAKYQNLPDSVLVHNNEILSDNAVNSLIDRIDYDYYIKKAYEKIAEYYDFDKVKEIKL